MKLLNVEFEIIYIASVAVYSAVVSFLLFIKLKHVNFIVIQVFNWIFC